MCSRCEDTEGEPLYQGILEVNTKQGENTEISGLKVRKRDSKGGWRQQGGDVVREKCKDSD